MDSLCETKEVATSRIDVEAIENIVQYFRNLKTVVRVNLNSATGGTRKPQAR
jgi:hypothetical protein